MQKKPLVLGESGCDLHFNMAVYDINAKKYICCGGIFIGSWKPTL